MFFGGLVFDGVGDGPEPEGAVEGALGVHGEIDEASNEVHGIECVVLVLVSLFAGFIIALLSMIGEYVVRTLQTVSTEESFHVVRRVGE